MLYKYQCFDDKHMIPRLLYAAYVFFGTFDDDMTKNNTNIYHVRDVRDIQGGHGPFQKQNEQVSKIK
jgi:hypothetical protein